MIELFCCSELRVVAYRRGLVVQYIYLTVAHVNVQGPVGYVPVSASRTDHAAVRSDQYEHIGGVAGEKVTTVGRRRRRSSTGVTLRRRSVAGVDRDQRPTSYQPQPADYINSAWDCVKSKQYWQIIECQGRYTYRRH